MALARPKKLAPALGVVRKDLKVSENKYQWESVLGREGGCANALRLERALWAQGTEDWLVLAGT